MSIYKLLILSLSFFYVVLLPIYVNSQEVEHLEIRLFHESGQMVSDYDEQVDSMYLHLRKNKTPVILYFSHGIVFTAYKVLGGNQHLILDIGNNQILRIQKYKIQYSPIVYKNDEIRVTTMLGVNSMKSYRKGYEVLSRNGVPVAQILSPKNKDREFFIMERLDLLFSYGDYLESEASFFDQFPMSLDQIDTDLMKFVEATAKFRNIGDFGGHQLFYTQKYGWTLVDWDNSHNNKSLRINGANIFEMDFWDHTREFVKAKLFLPPIRKPGFPSRLRAEAHKKIREVRSGKSNSCETFF